MEEHVVKVTILGRKLSIKTDATPESLSGIIAYVEKRADQLKKASLITDPGILSLLLNMILAEELLETKQKLDTITRDGAEESTRVDQLATDLIRMISREIDGKS